MSRLAAEKNSLIAEKGEREESGSKEKQRKKERYGKGRKWIHLRYYILLKAPDVNLHF
jgi:hypothetical protein